MHGQAGLGAVIHDAVLWIALIVVVAWVVHAIAAAADDLHGERSAPVRLGRRSQGKGSHDAARSEAHVARLTRWV